MNLTTAADAASDRRQHMARLRRLTNTLELGVGRLERTLDHALSAWRLSPEDRTV